MKEEVAAYLAGCTEAERAGLVRLRGLILERAAELPQVGRLEEALRWGQPAYLTPETGAGCSLRIGTVAGSGFALFVHCRTNLMARFGATVGAGQRIEGTRAVRFERAAEVQEMPMRVLIGWALTYHLAQK